jgi:hypothetical protein
MSGKGLIDPDDDAANMPRRRTAAEPCPPRPAAPSSPPAPTMTTPHLGPLLRLHPPSLEASFWVRWRRALMASDLIYSSAHLLLLDTGPGTFARSACPSMRLVSVLLPLVVWAAQRLLGPARYWRARPWLVLAVGPLLARGNSCYAIAFTAVNSPALERRGLAAAAAAAAGRLSPRAWGGSLAAALNSLVPACGAFMYALLLPVSFRLRLLMQAVEVLAIARVTTGPAARTLSAYFASLSSDPAAAALARPLGPCPSLVLVLLFDAWVGLLIPLGFVYLAELSAKEAHLRDLALGRAEAVAAARAAEAEEEAETAFSGAGAGDGRGRRRRTRTATQASASASAAPAARLLRLLARRGSPSGALRFLRFAHVMAVVAAGCYLSWWLVDAAVYVVLPRLAPAALAGAACPAVAVAVAAAAGTA